MYTSKARKGLGRHVRKDDTEGRFCRGRKVHKRGYRKKPRKISTVFGALNPRIRTVECLKCGARYSPLIGALKVDQYEYLKTITFYVNPDQLSALMIASQYNNAPGGPPAVILPFGSGCMELLPLFEDLNIPQAMIGATDIAMRQYLPPDILAFTVTKPMFQQLCELDEHSFLYKSFWEDLRKARGV